MQPRPLFVALVALAILNGIFSPAVTIVVALAPIWYPAWLPSSPPLLFMLASLVVSTTTLLLAGVPAALAERLVPSLADGPVPAGIWLAGVTLLSLAAIGRLLGA